MGGTTFSSLPDKLDSEACAQICGDQFKPEVFDSLKGEDGLVEKEAFVRYIQLRNTSSLSSNSAHVQERALKDIFQAYSHPNCGLNKVHYMQLLRDLRWMNAKFPSPQASAIFDEHVQEFEQLNYDTFRHQVLPAVAAKKEWEVSKALSRLSRHDSAVMAAYVSKKFLSHSQLDQIAEGTVDAVEGGDIEVTDAQRDAAIKLQALQRKKSSSKLLKELRNVQDITPDKDVFIVVDRRCDDPFEDKLFDLHKTVCKPYGNMMFGHFKTILSCLGVFDLKFTSRDADVAFKTIIALASHPNAGTYADRVVFGKAVDYSIFREIGLPLIADKKGIGLGSLKALVSQNIDSIDMNIFSLKSCDSTDNRDDEEGGIVVE